MLPDIDFPKTDKYRTGSAYEPLNFHMEALAESRHADLLFGNLPFHHISDPATRIGYVAGVAGNNMDAGVGEFLPGSGAIWRTLALL